MKAPSPPVALAVDPGVDFVSHTGVLWRINRISGEHALPWDELRYYGPVRGMRFDPHPRPPGIHDRGIMYAAGDFATAFAEVFQASRVITRSPDAELIGWQPVRALSLLDLTGTFLSRNGASVALTTGPKRYTQDWAHLIDSTLGDAIDGIRYISAMTGRTAVGLFEGSKHDPSFPLRAGFQQVLSSPSLGRIIARAATDLGFGVR
ncbi:RES family NAD+ phosphorylase [Herbiconiux sp. UC225_62]|uniref:RES family NAD+ phosphorylase n=1 Tax=Herbiconiux sp. UC225_62 TaxID=3350168 RepID=UPI0036D23DB0